MTEEQHFLILYRDYTGENKKLKAFAKKLEDIEDNFNDMYDLLEEELGEQDSDNPMYDNETEHVLCDNEC